MREGKLTGLEDFQLKLLIEELKCGTEKAENCLNQADKALESLQAELSSYLKKQGILTAASTLAVGGAAGAVAYGKQCYAHEQLSFRFYNYFKVGRCINWQNLFNYIDKQINKVDRHKM